MKTLNDDFNALIQTLENIIRKIDEIILGENDIDKQIINYLTKIDLSLELYKTLIEEIMDEIGDMKIDDIIKEMSGEDLTVEDMVAQTKELLKTPIKEVMPVEEELLEVLEAITINTAETEFTTTYDEDANLLSISVGASTNVKIKKDKENDLTITSDVSYELSEFSKSATEIQLPDIEWGKY
jgi:hypothetical protein